MNPDPIIIQEIEWMSQALLRVDTMYSKNLGEIPIFEQPCGQTRWRTLSWTSRFKEYHNQWAKKMKYEDPWWSIPLGQPLSVLPKTVERHEHSEGQSCFCHCDWKYSFLNLHIHFLLAPLWITLVCFSFCRYQLVELFQYRNDFCFFAYC